VGEGWGGKWYGGLMGWNWTFGGWGILGRGPRIGFANAMLVSGDASFIDALRAQAKNMLDNRIKTAAGLQLPDKYGDQGWSNPTAGPYHEALFSDIYLATLTGLDRDRLDAAAAPAARERRADPMWKYEYEAGRFEGGNEVAWIDYLRGNDPGYPERAFGDAFAKIRWMAEGIRTDTSTPDTRLADSPHQIRLSEKAPLGVFGAVTGALVNLTLGGRHPHWSGGLLYSELRYFDPVRRRPGLPESVAALVTGISADTVTVTLVNLDQGESREVVVQTGAYGEHQCRTVSSAAGTEDVNHRFFRVELAPGAGGSLRIQRAKYVNQPVLAQPWQ
jgi:hypothetical protein